MRQLKLKVRVQIAIVALFAFLALIPCQTQAMNLSYGDWEIDGFLRNNTGVWTENFTYAPNNDPLATCRNWFRLNLNGKISDSLKLKAEVLAVYEPEYSRERGGAIEANEYNYFDFREMRLDWRPAMGHNLRIGKQIVNWGESVTARIGDVVNPVDARWELGFTNLEDTRMPIWMIRGLHQISSIGTTLDWIFSPYLEPDRYRIARTLASPPYFTTNGTNNGANYNGQGFERFAPYADTRIIVHGIGQVNSMLPNNSAIVYSPWHAMIYGGLFTTGVPTVPEDLTYDYPDSSLADSRYGFKTSSNIFGTQTGVYFWRAHVHTPPVLYKGPTYTVIPGVLNMASLRAVYERQNTMGFYANKNYDFGVLRTDVAYLPDMEFQTDNFVDHPDLVCESNVLKVQLGYNKDFMFRPLNPDQTFGLIAEYIGEFLVGGDKEDALVAFVFHIPKPEDTHTFVMSLGTNYNFGMYAPNLTFIYNLENNGLIQPSFTYSPDWMNRKWRFTLQYTNVFGDNGLDFPYGLAREKDMVVLTTQFSF